MYPLGNPDTRRPESRWRWTYVRSGVRRKFVRSKAVAEDAAARQLAGDAEHPSTLIPLVNAARRAVLDLGRNAQSEHSRLRRDKLQEGNFEETAERVRSIDEMDMASKVTQLFKRARETPFPSLVARAERVRELLETARRRSDAKRPLQQKRRSTS